MKKYITMAILAAVALIGLVLILGELPEASMVTFVSAKITGCVLLLAAGKIWEHTMPEKEV